MASTPQYAAVPFIAPVKVTAVSSVINGSGPTDVVKSAGASGSRIDRITIKALGATQADVIYLYINNGTTKFLWKEITVISSANNWYAELASEILGSQLPLLLPSGYSLEVAAKNNSNYNVFATGGNF